MSNATRKFKIDPKIVISIALMAVVVAGSLLYVIGFDTQKTEGDKPVVETKLKTDSTLPIDFKTIEGRWVRPDGGYVLALSNASATGSIVAEYFNPSSVHVEEAGIMVMDGSIILNVLLNDQNYPNCRYTLYYESKQDVLVGTYEQTMIGQTYQIYFERVSKK